MGIIDNLERRFRDKANDLGHDIRGLAGIMTDHDDVQPWHLDQIEMDANALQKDLDRLRRSVATRRGVLAQRGDPRHRKATPPTQQ